MNTLVNTKYHYNTDLNHFKRVLVVLMLICTTTSAFAMDSYQKKMLFTPSDSMLKAEAKGRIMIYDGMESEMVDKAMNEQFDRIDNMMFIRIHHTQDGGGYLVEDDGC